MRGLVPTGPIFEFIFMLSCPAIWPFNLKGRCKIPNFDFELQVKGFCAGVDEVGRGPLAGPVIACAYVFKTYHLPKDFLDQIDDSKKLSLKKRHRLKDNLNHYGYFGFGAASLSEIDNLNILQASLLAMQRAVKNLPINPDTILVDGTKKPVFNVPCVAIPKGDSLSFSIAAASILAKLCRDKIMHVLGERYPYYAWQKNAGYGTKEHRDAILTHGISRHHRLSFAPIRQIVETEKKVT